MSAAPPTPVDGQTCVVAVCQQCHAGPVLRGASVCGECHPLSPHDAYRRGLCRDCRSTPHSAGRPRCNDCHADYLDALAGGQASTSPASPDTPVPLSVTRAA